MPTSRIDQKTGAILFRQTADEKNADGIDKLKKDISKLKSRLSALEKAIKSEEQVDKGKE